VTHVNPVMPAIHVMPVNPVIHAMVRVKHVNHVIHVNVFVILVKRAITYAKRATHVGDFEVMED